MTFSDKPVLGLFVNEAELRDQLAAQLDRVEPGLVLLAKEYVLTNELGAGGRTDILARDPYDHLVCIEIKRSDRSARDTLNELSKYVALLVEQDRVPREMIRCLVVSTEWHELLLPLSYFAVSSGVDVRAILAREADGELVLEEQALLPLRFLPQLSPELDCLAFADEAARRAYLDHVGQRVDQLPFLRVALLLLTVKTVFAGSRPPFKTIASIWRIAERHLSALEATLKEDFGALEPYGFPGWEAECDAQVWTCIDGAPGILPTTASAHRGTPEKISNLLKVYVTSRM